MIRYFFLFTTVVVFLSSPALAQEEGMKTALVLPLATEEQQSDGEVEAADNKDINAQDAAYEARLKLARDMHKIWPVRPKIERALDRIAKQIEPQNRMRFKSAMRKAINFNTVEQTSIESMADIFTAKELEAMIAFYGSKEGRSVSFKTDDYERALQPVLVKMLDKAILDTKLGQ